MANKAKQERLPSTDDELIKPLVDTAENLYEVRSERMSLTKREKQLADELISLMKEHKKTTYKYEDTSIELKMSEEKVKVRIKSEDDIDVEAVEDEE